MNKNNKSTISQANSYEEIGEYWDKQDLTEVWGKTKPVEFEINIQSEQKYFSVDPPFSIKLREIAEEQGVTPQALLNSWIQEKILQRESVKH